MPDKDLRTPERRACVVCGQFFPARRSDALTCSPKCRKARSREMTVTRRIAESLRGKAKNANVKPAGKKPARKKRR